MNGRLKLAIIAKGRKQYELAAEMGMSETRLSRIVSGRLAPSADEQHKLARLLDVPVEALFTTANREEEAR
jgi:transcriptional regulator with XRE-family HTH domain